MSTCSINKRVNVIPQQSDRSSMINCGDGVCVCASDCVAKWLKHLTVNQKITGSSPTSYHLRKKSFFLHLAPNPGPRQVVNWGPGLGWGRTCPLVVPNSTEVQVGLRVPTPQQRGIASHCSCECLAWLQEFV